MTTEQITAPPSAPPSTTSVAAAASAAASAASPKTETETEIETPFLSINGTPIYFEEDWDTGIGGGLWSTGKAMAMYFIDHPTLIRQNLYHLHRPSENEGNGGDGKGTDNDKGKGGSRGAKVMELGSGNGLLSVCLAAVACQDQGQGHQPLIDKLVVTDLDDHLELMVKTVLANSHIITLDGNNANGNGNGNNHTVYTEVKEHRWGEFEDDINEDTFDFIIGSDVAYRDWLHEPLIQSLKKYSHPGTVSLIGVTMHDTKPQFFKLLKEHGFTYQRIHEHHMAPEFRGVTFGLFVIQLKT